MIASCPRGGVSQNLASSRGGGEGHLGPCGTLLHGELSRPSVEEAFVGSLRFPMFLPPSRHPTLRRHLRLASGSATAAAPVPQPGVLAFAGEAAGGRGQARGCFLCGWAVRAPRKSARLPSLPGSGEASLSLGAPVSRSRSPSRLGLEEGRALVRALRVAQHGSGNVPRADSREAVRAQGPPLEAAPGGPGSEC